MSVVTEEETTGNSAPRIGTITTIFIAEESAAPMKSIPSARLIQGVGIEGDRYATNIRRGTYSGIFMAEPGRNLTLVSQDAIQEKIQELSAKDRANTKFTMDQLRRNVVVQGLSAKDVNDMVGRDIQLGNCRLFVHRRNVPCKYRAAQTQCPNFRNLFWEDCGICCEILEGGTIQVGDKLKLLPGTPSRRCDVGLKPPPFFIKPSERSPEDTKAQIIPIHIAIALCLWDPKGFEQVEKGYRKVGQHFWSPRAYQAGMFVKKYVRTPLFVAVSVGVASIAIQAALSSLKKLP